MHSYFFSNDTATTEIYTLSLHDALPIFAAARPRPLVEHALDQGRLARAGDAGDRHQRAERQARSEEHTSELQSQSNLVCRLLLEKKNRLGRRRRRGGWRQTRRRAPKHRV